MLKVPVSCNSCLVKNLALGALTTSSLWTGTALYISIGDHPTRMHMDSERAMLSTWKKMYEVAAPVQATLVIVSTAAGAILAYKTGRKEWLVGAGLMIANLPYTMLCIMPLNNKLSAIKDEDATNQNVKAKLQQWGNLHVIRTLLGLAAVGGYCWAFHKVQV